ncbi:PREDICTED: uncharacterized protein LOC108368794 [Rhagoletis zephyria]|uniref:uncharacterized protein LOC108368794 n=1 Tax=Rhagoletis zephyria TaxID=28612 RepID=UPI00081199BE|nr:PREDICTED: uncharacterized protein LOC108368794 [Rhagoletis zephyria]
MKTHKLWIPCSMGVQLARRCTTTQSTWRKYLLIAAIFFFIPDTSTALSNVSVSIPSAVKRGDNAILICNYNLEYDNLYTVKWYRGRREFYRYTPKENPALKIFPASGGYTVDRKIFYSLFFHVADYPSAATAKTKLVRESQLLSTAAFLLITAINSLLAPTIEAIMQVGDGSHPETATERGKNATENQIICQHCPENADGERERITNSSSEESAIVMDGLMHRTR